jgi:hypothetical protein
VEVVTAPDILSATGTREVETGRMASKTPRPITIDELEVIAKESLPQNVYEYYACGSDEQKCLRRNRTAFDRYAWL